MYILSAVDPSTGVASHLAGFSAVDSAYSALDTLVAKATWNATGDNGVVVYAGVTVNTQNLRVDYVPEWEDWKVGV